MAAPSPRTHFTRARVPRARSHATQSASELQRGSPTKESLTTRAGRVHSGRCSSNGASSCSCTTQSRSAASCSLTRNVALTAAINALRTEETHEAEELQRSADVRECFEEIAAYLADIDVDAIWEEATEQERRVLIDELLVAVEVHGDHLEVVVRGAPRVNITLEEVGVSCPKGEERSCRRGDLRLEATPPLTRNRHAGGVASNGPRRSATHLTR